MPNFFRTVIKSDLIGQLLTFTSLLAVLVTCISVLFTNVVEARTNEAHRTDNDTHLRIERLTEVFLSKEQWREATDEREKRFQSEAKSIREDISDIKTMQTEQRALTHEILQRLPK